MSHLLPLGFWEQGEVFKILYLVLILSCLPALGRKDLHPSFKTKRSGRAEWVPKPSGERGQAGHRPANEMKPHTIHCFDYLKHQHLGKQVRGKGIFLGFPEGVWTRKSFKDTCQRRKKVPGTMWAWGHPSSAAVISSLGLRWWGSPPRRLAWAPAALSLS